MDKKIIIIISVLVLIVVAIAVYFFMIKDDEIDPIENKKPTPLSTQLPQ